MPRNAATFIGLLILVFAFGGCQKMLFPNDGDATPTAVFEHLWNDLNERYSYFELKEVDWDAVGEEYRAMVHDELDPYELFDLLGDLLATLEDGHVNILSTFNRSRNWNWYEQHPLNYDNQLIDVHYLKTDFRIIGPLHVQTVGAALYVRCRSFATEISDAHVDELMRLMPEHTGLIIDIRGNGGGNLRNALALSSALVEEELTYAYTRYKNGRAHNDFTPWIAQTIQPREGTRYSGRVAVLTNRKAYSSATFFAQMANAIPQARLFGDQTGGGGGTPAYAELPNGWTYRFSASQTKGLNDDHLEVGVLPDEVLMLDSDLSAQGVDNIIEAAVEWVSM